MSAILLLAEFLREIRSPSAWCSGPRCMALLCCSSPASSPTSTSRLSARKYSARCSPPTPSVLKVQHPVLPVPRYASPVAAIRPTSIPPHAPERHAHRVPCGFHHDG